MTIKKIQFIITVALFTALSSIAQKPFEGTITYSISLEADNVPKEALAMFNGTEAVTYIKGDKIRTDMNMVIQSTSSIYDTKAKTSVTLMDFMGEKYLIRSTQED